MGGSKVAAPEPPSVMDTSEQAIQAQIKSLPDILKAQQEYGPQFAQTALSLNAQFAPELYKQTQEMNKALNPEMVAGQQVLNQYLSQSDLLSPEELRQAKEDARSAYGVRGLGGSGMAAQQELLDLTKLRQSLKTQRLNTALSVMGLTPITGQSSQQVQVPQLVQNIDPNNIFGLVNNNYNNLTQQMGYRQNAKTTQQGQWIKAGTDIFGSIMGAL